MKLKKNIYLWLISAVFISSFSSVLAKKAAQYSLLSFQFVFFYGGALMILALYSVIWQLCLEKIELVKAYMIRGLLFVFIGIWSVVIYHEEMSLLQVLAIIIITIGVGVSQADGE